MKLSKATVFVEVILLFTSITSCGAPSGTPGPPTSTPTNGKTLPPLTGDNVMTLTVNGSNCSSNSYPNKPCVRVKVCEPGSASNCQTIDDILLDTGSFGLRVFSSALNDVVESTLPSVSIGGNVVAECARFGDGSSDWGPVKTADIVLANEAPVQVPIHVIDSTFSSVHSSCSNPDTGPNDAGFNGILGVGVFQHDCGNFCVTSSSGNNYFTCTSTTGGTCTSTTVALAKQVQNPVPLLSTDNNGLIVELPSVSIGGVSFANGYVVLGIGTRSNNSPTGVTMYPTDSGGDFTTVFNGHTYTSSFLDTGSNGLFFPASAVSLTDCGTYHSALTGWYCPPSVVNYTATNTGAGGSPSVVVPFQIGNFYNLAVSSYNVYVESGADGGGSNSFDWGLPFYLGRNVYLGFEGKTSSLGTGPYWAF